MTSEQIPVPAENRTESVDPEAKLLRLDENKKGSPVVPAKDINNKITSLDSDLAQLRTELSAINNSVEEGLDRLTDTDTDLTAKVSETYKRLGEIDNAYKSLLEISSRIDTDIRKLNGDVSVVARQTASGIKNLEQSTLVQSSEFARENQKLVSKVEQLAETSRLTGELLKEKIHYVTDRILQVEKNLLADIEALSAQSASESERLDNTIEANSARIIKLQSVDEAIIKRATTLEISSAELTVKSRQLETAVEQLQTSSNTLFAELSALKTQANSLQAQNTAQAKQITGLEAESGALRSSLTLLAAKVDRHFVSLAGALTLVLLVSLAFYFYQQSRFEEKQQMLVKSSRQLSERFEGLQQNQLELATAAAQAKLAEGLAAIESDLADMRDQVDSIEGRFNNEAPFSQIGDDNIIHGESWLLAQPAENYMIELARLEGRPALYELATRYNHYLDQRLSAYTDTRNGAPVYVLLAGNYARPQQAAEVIDRLPASLAMEKPALTKLRSIQGYINQKAAR